MIWDTREPMGGSFLPRIVDELNRLFAAIFVPVIVVVQITLDIIFWGLILFLDNIIFISVIGLVSFLLYRIFFPMESQSWSPRETKDEYSTLIQEEPEETVDEDPLAFWESMVEEKGKLEWGSQKEDVSDIDFLKAEYKRIIESDFMENLVKGKKRKR